MVQTSGGSPVEVGSFFAVVLLGFLNTSQVDCQLDSEASTSMSQNEITKMGLCKYPKNPEPSLQ